MTYHVLNTRSVHQASSLTEALSRIGATVFHLPLFEIQSLSFEPIDLTDVTDVIFVSHNAVYAFFEKQKWHDDFVRVFAIGPATQKALHEKGVKKVYLPEKFDSEGILLMPDMQSASNKKIVIVCGENTKSVLADTFKKRGGEVIAVITYRRQRLHYDMNAILPQLIAADINLLIAASMESYAALLALFHDPAHRQWLLQKTICVVHDKMKKQAERDGFARIVCASNPTTEAIVNVITKELVMTEQPAQGSSSAGAYWASAIAVMISIAAIIVCVLNFQSSLENKYNQKSQTAQLQLIQKQLNVAQKPQHNEILYLVHLANMQLTVGHDAASALKTLQFAVKQVPPTQLGMTNTLNADIAQLQSAAIVDRDSIFANLAAMNQSIQLLNAMPSKPAAPVLQPVPINSTEKTWRDRAMDYFKSIKTLFIIRHVNESVTPLFDAQSEFAVKQNMYLQLSLAQWGLMHRDEKIFQTSLQAVKNDLTRYFALTDETKPLLEKITALQKININPALPSLENTTVKLSMSIDHAEN